MIGAFLAERLDFLLAAQNADGGWGYFPGKQSWLEPTAYAMLALHGRDAARGALDLAWNLVGSWQRPDGGWRPSAQVEGGQWTTALCVTLHCAWRRRKESLFRAVDWLLATKGAEGKWWRRVVNRLNPSLVGHDPNLLGWPWLPATDSWVEPTAHALVALKLAWPLLREQGFPKHRELEDRVRMGEKMLLERRCQDGGWNYGNRFVLGEVLPSYPETTAVALLGLQGAPEFDPGQAIQFARGWTARTRSALARAWLAICLRNYGAEGPGPPSTATTSNILLAALEALGASGGNHGLLKPGANS